ncbi:MAG: FAD-binding oxidoreductase [Gammaproteobacteria bacterium]|nr:FAD-binding oxidoreductase [Gammaproteobacteria bacterium]
MSPDPDPTPTKPAVEVAIVGGGIVGCATAYFLASRGIEVALFEKAASPGSSRAATEARYGRSAGRCRNYR